MAGPVEIREWWSPAELAEARLPGLPKTARSINRDLSQKRLVRSKSGRLMARRRDGRGGGWEYHIGLLPWPAREHLKMKSARAAMGQRPEDGQAMAAAAGVVVQDAWERWDRLTAAKKQVTRERLALLTQVDALYLNGTDMQTAVAMVAQRSGYSKSAIYAWKRMCDGQERRDWLAFLAPRHKGRVVTSVCSPEAWEAYKADYLRLEKPTHAACYERLKPMAEAHGWDIPSARTLARRMDREVSKMVLTLQREGEKAARKLYPAQKRDRTQMHALEGVNADGHTLDVWVKWHDGEVIRPVATVVADLYSNKVLGYRIDKSESATAVRLAFHDVFRDWGIPDWALLDNGRAFASKQITGGQKTRFRFKVTADEAQGVLTALGIKVHWATPYSGQSKPIERIFRSFCDHIAKAPQFAGAYAGNSPVNKPDYTHDPRDKAVDFDLFMAVFDAGVKAFNARTGRRADVCGGRLSYDQAFANSYAEVPIRKASEKQLHMAMLSATKVTALAPSGEVKLLENRFWAEFLGERIGERLTLRFDPDNLHKGVQVYDQDDAYLGEATALTTAGFHSVEDARVHGKKRRDYLRTLKEAARIEQSMSLDDYLKMMPEAGEPAPAPEAKTVRLVRTAGAAAALAPVAEAEVAAETGGFDFDAFGRGLRLISRDDEI